MKIRLISRSPTGGDRWLAICLKSLRVGTICKTKRVSRKMAMDYGTFWRRDGETHGIISQGKGSTMV